MHINQIHFQYLKAQVNQHEVSVSANNTHDTGSLVFSVSALWSKVWVHWFMIFNQTTHNSRFNASKTQLPTFCSVHHVKPFWIKSEINQPRASAFPVSRHLDYFFTTINAKSVIASAERWREKNALMDEKQLLVEKKISGYCLHILSTNKKQH